VKLHFPVQFLLKSYCCEPGIWISNAISIQVVEVLTKLAQLTVNTSTIVQVYMLKSHIQLCVFIANLYLFYVCSYQAAVPSILQNTPSEFFDKTLSLLEYGAELCCRRIRGIKGLDCTCKPQGTMFIMVSPK
jgi:aspartate/methionine/tyrosine aminotransferase